MRSQRWRSGTTGIARIIAKCMNAPVFTDSNGQGLRIKTRQWGKAVLRTRKEMKDKRRREEEDREE
eukprot:9529735-Karenia_brevis.AAC.1